MRNDVMNTNTHKQIENQQSKIIARHGQNKHSSCGDCPGDDKPIKMKNPTEVKVSERIYFALDFALAFFAPASLARRVNFCMVARLVSAK